MNAEHADLEARFAAPADRGLPPGRHELHREILMNHMLTESGQARRHRPGTAVPAGGCWPSAARPASGSPRPRWR